MAGVLNILLEELERREEYRHMNRNLRDTSNPFQIPEVIFRQFYRLSREAAYDLFLEIEPHMKEPKRCTKISKVIRFTTVLHFFSHGSYQKPVGRDSQCALSQPSVSRCIKEITTIMNEHMAERYINFPNNLRKITEVKYGFYDKFNFPGVIGCIDCTHIAIVPPPANDPVYPGLVFINRKNFSSINCQIICDSNLKIRHINARYPGSVHDAAIWMVSDIKQFMLQNYQNDRTTWLLGDSGYPLQPFSLTPILDALPGTPEERYTTSHLRTTNTVERCIGVFKAYFRCLHKDRVLHYRPEIAAKIIYSCAILYNILRDRNIIDEGLENNAEVDDGDVEDNEEALEPINLLNEARAIRNNLLL